MKAVFLDRGSFPEHIKIQLPASIKEVVEYQNTRVEQVAERIKNASIVLTNKAIVDAAAIHSASDLKLIQVMATGKNNVDLVACKESNITVCTNCKPKENEAELSNMKKRNFQAEQHRSRERGGAL